eukprot:COSAG02_NODE_31037_length_540_cov_1.138322_1_plen_29_part_10
METDQDLTFLVGSWAPHSRRQVTKAVWLP